MKVPRNSLERDDIMKNLLDKPYKSLYYKYFGLEVAIYLSIVVVVMTGIALVGLYIPSTNQEVKSNPIIEQYVLEDEPELEVDRRVRPTITKTEVASVTLKTRKVALSRGGSPFPQTSEQETIDGYVRDICSKYNMEPTLIKSIIKQESNYNPKAANGNCLGLMQVSSRWHKNRADRLGITDFYDPYSNILLGVDYLSELYNTHKDMRLALMLYNMKHDTAISMYENGQISNYAKTIMARAEEYKKGE
jgi:hypothetical protein